MRRVFAILSTCFMYVSLHAQITAIDSIIKSIDRPSTRDNTALYQYTSNGVLNYLSSDGTHMMRYNTHTKQTQEDNFSKGTYFYGGFRSISPDGKYLLTSSASPGIQSFDSIKVSNLDDYSSYKVPISSTNVKAITYSTDQKTLIVSEKFQRQLSGTTILHSFFDLASGQLKKTLEDTCSYYKTFFDNIRNYPLGKMSLTSDSRFFLQTIEAIINNKRMIVLSIFDLELSTITYRAIPNEFGGQIAFLEARDTSNYTIGFHNIGNYGVDMYKTSNGIATLSATPAIQYPMYNYHYHQIVATDMKKLFAYNKDNPTNLLYFHQYEENKHDSITLPFTFTYIVPSSPNRLFFFTTSSIVEYDISQNKVTDTIFKNRHWKKGSSYLRFRTRNNTSLLVSRSSNETIVYSPATTTRFDVPITDFSSNDSMYITKNQVVFPFEPSKSFPLGGFPWFTSFSADNKFILVAKDYNLFALDIKKQSLAYKYLPTRNESLYSITISESKKYLCGGMNDYSIVLWEVNKPQASKVLVGHYDKPVHTVTSKSDSLLASFGNDGTIRIWSIAEGIEKQRMLSNNLLDMVFSAKDNYLISTHTDSTLRVWDVTNGKLLKTFKSFPKIQYSIAISSDGNTIVTSSMESDIIYWNVRELGLWDIVSVQDNTPDSSAHTTAYPIPCSDNTLHFRTATNLDVTQFNIVSATGSVLFSSTSIPESIDVSSFAAGYYRAFVSYHTHTESIPILITR